jgi:hypothetical protein
VTAASAAYCETAGKRSDFFPAEFLHSGLGLRLRGILALLAATPDHAGAATAYGPRAESRSIASEFRRRSAIRCHIYALAVWLRSLAQPARKPQIGRGLLRLLQGMSG